MIFDLEAFRADDAFRRPNFVRLGGYRTGGQNTLTTDGNEITEAINSTTEPVAGHNIFAFDLPVMARWHGLDLTTLRGRCRDTDLLVRLDDPPPSGHKGQVSHDLRPRGYYGLDQSCVRYGLAHKTDDLAVLAGRFAAVAKRIKQGKEVRPSDRIGDLAEVERLTEDATLPGGKIDGYGVIPAHDPDYRSYLDGDLIASEALADRLSPLDAYARREMEVGLITAQMRVNGFRVDVDELERTLKEQEIRRRDNLQELHDITGMPLKGVNPIRSLDGNRALAQAFIDAGIKPTALPRTEKNGTLSTGREALTEFRDFLREKAKGRDISRIERIIELIISVSGERTVFQTIDDQRVGDRMHFTTKPVQASGRWSSGVLTVMGKRQGRYVERRVFAAEEGHVLVAFDADQVDARGVAAHSGDENYCRIFREGLDLHGEVAEEIFGDRARREDVKPLNHGMNYGMGAQKASENTGLPLADCYRFAQGLRLKYPRVVLWQEQVREWATSGELLDNGFGRKLRSDPRFAYTQGPALVGQGCTRDIMAEGLLRLPVEYWPYLRGIIHDEIVFSLPERDWREMAEVIQGCMQFDLADVTGGRLVSMPITVGVSKPGKTWDQCYAK